MCPQSEGIYQTEMAHRMTHTHTDIHTRHTQTHLSHTHTHTHSITHTLYITDAHTCKRNHSSRDYHFKESINVNRDNPIRPIDT